MLVRVSSTGADEAGEAVEPQGQRPPLEQLSPRMHYSDGGYYSSSARPTPGETRLMSAMMHRSHEPFNLLLNMHIST